MLAAEQTPPTGLILHDPALGMQYTGTLGLVAPTFSWTSDEYDRGGVRCGQTYHCKGAFHGNFVDAPLWAPPWVMRTLSAVIPAAGPCDPAEMHEVLARTAADVMRSNLGGDDLTQAALIALSSEPSLELRGATRSSRDLPLLENSKCRALRALTCASRRGSSAHLAAG